MIIIGYIILMIITIFDKLQVVLAKYSFIPPSHHLDMLTKEIFIWIFFVIFEDFFDLMCYLLLFFIRDDNLIFFLLLRSLALESFAFVLLRSRVHLFILFDCTEFRIQKFESFFWFSILMNIQVVTNTHEYVIIRQNFSQHSNVLELICVEESIEQELLVIR